MWYAIFYYFITVKHLVTSDAPQFRPVVRMSELQKIKDVQSQIQRPVAPVHPPFQSKAFIPQSQFMQPLNQPPFHSINNGYPVQMPFPMMQNEYQPQTPVGQVMEYNGSVTLASYKTTKRKRRSKPTRTAATMRGKNKIVMIRISSSTRPPYPGGIRPETVEISGDYRMCDGNAICHKYVWAQTKKKKNFRRNLITRKSLIV